VLQLKSLKMAKLSQPTKLLSIDFRPIFSAKHHEKP